MKNTLYLLLLLPLFGFGQTNITLDSLYFVDGAVEGVKIIEIDDQNVKYRFNGEPFTISTSLLKINKIFTTSGRIIEFDRQLEESDKIDSTYYGVWKIKYYVDDFGDYTDNGYITNGIPFVGTFSNSATSNSDLAARILVTDSLRVDIMLYEYSSSKVKAYSNQNYIIKVKLENDSIIIMNGSMSENSDRISIYGLTDFWGKPKTPSKLHNVLMKNKNISIVIKEANSLTNYKFSFDNSGYSNAINGLYPLNTSVEKIDSVIDETTNKQDTIEIKKLDSGIYYNNTRCSIVKETSIDEVIVKSLNETGRAYDKLVVKKEDLYFHNIDYSWSWELEHNLSEQDSIKLMNSEPGFYYQGIKCIILEELSEIDVKIKYHTETGRGYYRKIVRRTDITEIK